MRPACLRLPPFPAVLAVLAALWFGGCASTRDAVPAEDAARPPMDKVLARLVFKGEFDKAFRAADSLAGSKDPAEREIANYWKTVTWLYRGEPDSALTLLEANQGKWTGGLRKVHAGLFLGLAREASLSRAAGHARHDDPAKPAPDKSLQDRFESLQKENGELRAETVRLASEKEKYQKLLKDLETIR
jgi:hypothetical protein